jgi:hypothetical protein
VVSVLLQVQPKPVVLKVVTFLMLMGAISSVYVLIELIKWYAI